MNSHSNTRRDHAIDALRCFLIILVVLGHVSNPFGPFIYQFHVAAFFILSGYLLNGEENLVTFVKKRLQRLIVPYLFMNLALDIFARLFGRLTSPNYFPTTTLRGFLTSLSTNPLAGASWFLPVLFLASTVVFVVIKLCLNKKPTLWASSVFSLAFFALAYHLFSRKIMLPYMADLSILAAGYMMAGYSLKLLKNHEFSPPVTFIVLFYLVFRAAFAWNGTNWPTRSFSNPWDNVSMALGAFLGFNAFFHFLEKSALAWILDPLKRYGAATLPILFLHFLAFKLMYAIFYQLGLVTQKQLSELVLVEAPTLWPWVAVSGILLPITIYSMTKNAKWFGRLAWGEWK